MQVFSFYCSVWEPTAYEDSGCGRSSAREVFGSTTPEPSGNAWLLHSSGAILGPYSASELLSLPNVRACCKCVRAVAPRSSSLTKKRQEKGNPLLGWQGSSTGMMESILKESKPPTFQAYRFIHVGGGARAHTHTLTRAIKTIDEYSKSELWGIADGVSMKALRFVFKKSYSVAHISRDQHIKPQQILSKQEKSSGWTGWDRTDIILPAVIGKRVIDYWQYLCLSWVVINST